MTIVVGEVVGVDDRTIKVQIPSSSVSTFERIHTVEIPTGKTKQDYPEGSRVKLEVIQSVGTRPSLRVIVEK